MKTMRYLTFLIASLLIIGGLVSCDDDIKPQQFEGVSKGFSYFAKSDDGQSIHYVVGSEIQFTSTSSVARSWNWRFGDGATSTDENPTHVYTTPGTYDIVLEVNGGEKTYTGRIYISPIVPVVRFHSSDDRILFQESEVAFEILLEYPGEEEVVFTWRFPEGATGEMLDENRMTNADNPVVKFGAVGSQRVNLTVKIGDEELTPVSVRVDVDYNEPVPTIFYAVKDGNIMARRIIEDLDPELNLPFDLGYRSGKHPLSMQFGGDWLYVFDAGTHTAFVSDNAIKGDGEIFAIRYDGQRRESVIQNFGGDSFQDFYYGFVDVEAGHLYWADRREGVFRVPLSTRNRKFSFDEFDYFVRNYWLGYYGRGIGWGHTNGQFMRVGDQFWWAKHSSGSGIFRFVESDILGRPKTDDDALPEAGVLFSGLFKVRALAVDEVNGHIYVADQTTKGIFRTNLAGDLSTLHVVYFPGEDSGEGGGAESLFITDFAINHNPDGTGYIYWGYRAPSEPSNPNNRSGLMRAKLNDSSGEVEHFISDIEVYGVAIDNQLR